MTSDLVKRLAVELERLANKYEHHPELPDDNSFTLSDLYVEVQEYLQPNDAIGICPKCNIELTQTMCYCCPENNCPCGLGSIMCSVNK